VLHHPHKTTAGRRCPRGRRRDHPHPVCLKRWRCIKAAPSPTAARFPEQKKRTLDGPVWTCAWSQASAAGSAARDCQLYQPPPPLASATQGRLDGVATQILAELLGPPRPGNDCALSVHICGRYRAPATARLCRSPLRRRRRRYCCLTQAGRPWPIAAEQRRTPRAVIQSRAPHAGRSARPFLAPRARTLTTSSASTAGEAKTLNRGRTVLLSRRRRDKEDSAWCRQPVAPSTELNPSVVHAAYHPGGRTRCPRKKRRIGKARRRRDHCPVPKLPAWFVQVNRRGPLKVHGGACSGHAHEAHVPFLNLLLARALRIAWGFR